MVIELLKFKVTPERREEFVQKDTKIWTAMLANSPGFISKEVWINPHDTSQLVLVIRWESREQWNAVPQELLEKTEAEFALAMGNSYQIIETGEYQVRKFSH